MHFLQWKNGSYKRDPLYGKGRILLMLTCYIGNVRQMVLEQKF